MIPSLWYTCTFQGSRCFKHHQNSTKGPPRERQKERKLRRERQKKKARNFGIRFLAILIWPFLASPFLAKISVFCAAPKGGGSEGWRAEPRTSGAPKGEVGPKGGPKILRFPSPATIFFLFVSLSLSGSCRWILVMFWSGGTLEMCTFGVLGLSCEAPVNSVSWDSLSQCSQARDGRLLLSAPHQRQRCMLLPLPISVEDTTEVGKMHKLSKCWWETYSDVGLRSAAWKRCMTKQTTLWRRESWESWAWRNNHWSDRFWTLPKPLGTKHWQQLPIFLPLTEETSCTAQKSSHITWQRQQQQTGRRWWDWVRCLKNRPRVRLWYKFQETPCHLKRTQTQIGQVAGEHAVVQQEDTQLQGLISSKCGAKHKLLWLSVQRQPNCTA